MKNINSRNLRALRARRNMTLDELQEASGVNRVTISRIENDKSASTRKVTLERLAGALGTDVQTLTGPDIEEDERSSPFSGRKTQMNFRMADDARNALTLVGLRYGVKPAHILHLAPFLFLWAAEASLKRRSERMDEISSRWDELQNSEAPRHLHSLLQFSWQADDVIVAERESIAARDLFGLQIPDDLMPERYEDNEENPFAQFLASLAEELGELAQFDYWSPYWDQPGYSLGTQEAEELTGGNKEAALQIVSGHAPLHEMPREVREIGPEAVAAWAIETGEQYRKKYYPEFEPITGDSGEETGDG